MNFLNFFTSGAGIFNFNLQNLSLNNTKNSLLRPIAIKATSQISEGINEEKVTSSTQLILTDQEKICENAFTTTQTQLLNQRQQLINQYMHLNIQLLSQKIQSLQHIPEKKQESNLIETKTNKKKIKKINSNCGHNDRQHYAKGMCNNCYHKSGRTKKPWKCGHQKLYANGLCQNCYINSYNKTKREKNHLDNLNSELQDSKQIQSDAKIENSQ